MPRTERLWSGWRGVGLIAITYVYFLIFAQFAFLKRLAELGIADTHLKTVMGAMAAGGILLSLLAPRLAICESPARRLRISLTICAATALLTLLPLGLGASIALAFLIGSGLGLLTVTLVTHLRLWLSQRNPLLSVGIGTGIGYFICNVPPFFAASVRVQALTAAGVCLAGVVFTFNQAKPSGIENRAAQNGGISFPFALACFTALVWLDSAAFFIIQNTPALKAGTWEGAAHLWTDGCLHFAGAIFSVFLLRRRGLWQVLSLAFAALGLACVLLLDPARAVLASAFYPVAVSLYSVALVAYPSILSPAASTAERGRQAGWIYAIAGWFGSAMGIGMGQNLGHVPVAFVAIAGTIVLSPGLIGLLRQRRRELAATIGILLAAFCIEQGIAARQPANLVASQVERGRGVYISEGCINCHSQYVRPNTADVLLWGPLQTLDEVRNARPPLIGNRRQGPDLAEVGSRRSPLWMKAHFYNPAEVSHTSFMPSYRYLFADDRGDDLIAYLQNLKSSNLSSHFEAEASWRPPVDDRADVMAGARLFGNYCATCHAANGSTRQMWRTSFKRLPPDLTLGPFLHVPAAAPSAERIHAFARIVKFGIPGTDMPGHEYLADRGVASISLWLADKTSIHSGEKQ